MCQAGEPYPVVGVKGKIGGMSVHKVDTNIPCRVQVKETLKRGSNFRSPMKKA